MSPTFIIERVTVALPPDVERLAAEAREEGFHHVERLVAEWEAGLNRFDAPGEALFVARNGDRLVGLCGLNRDPYAEAGERAGRVRRMYVRADERRTGVGRALLGAVIAHATGAFAELRLRADDAPADAFYRAAGFVRLSEECGPHTTHRLPRLPAPGFGSASL